jgi:hypothetical protein
MNQIVVATEDLIPLQVAPDVLVSDAPSDISLDTLGIGDKAEKRSVRFASNVSKIVGRVLSRDDFSENEKADYWIGRKEFVHCQSKAKIVVTTIKKHGPAYVVFLEESYKVAQNLSEFMVDDNDIKVFFGDPSRYTEKVEIWSAANYDQRGLERYIYPLQKSQRALEKYGTRRMVLVAAKMGMRVDELAAMYAAISWTTCIYSRMLGHADYVAAYFAEDDPPVRLKPVQMPSIKNEHHSEQCIQNLEVQVVQNPEIKLHAPSQDRRIMKQGHVSTQGTLVSRAA